MRDDEFLKFMELRKTEDSNLVLHLFSNPHQYRECVRYYINLLEDLGLLEIVRKRPDKTTFDLKNGIKLELLLTKSIKKLYGYRYKEFRLFGEFTD